MSARGIVDAYEKPVTVWGFDDLKNDLKPAWIGLKGSAFIIAINKDESCPMMKIADLGIVGDLHVIVPKLKVFVPAKDSLLGRLSYKPGCVIMDKKYLA